MPQMVIYLVVCAIAHYAKITARKKITMTTNTISVALCESRHPMPECVKGSIFPNTIENPFDYDDMENIVMKWVELHQNATKIELYVTGMTVALIQALKTLVKYYSVTLMHYDIVSKGYITQEIN